MSIRYFLHLSYDGFAYRGWQRQDGIVSIQETIENALSHILKTPVSLVGCGRTDAQVHATQFIAHMDIETSWDYDLVYRLNQLLPSDIVIHDILKMEGTPHARFDASERSYEYFIHTEKNPFLNGHSFYFANKNINFDLMKSAVSLLTKYEDYQSFCKTPDHNQTTICKVSSANIQINQSGNQIQFQITANRFLRGMIRVIAQKLLEVGTNEISLAEFESLFINKTTPDIKAIAAPYGLYLTKVTYPFLNLPTSTLPPPKSVFYF